MANHSNSSIWGRRMAVHDHPGQPSETLSQNKKRSWAQLGGKNVPSMCKALDPIPGTTHRGKEKEEWEIRDPSR